MGLIHGWLDKWTGNSVHEQVNVEAGQWLGTKVGRVIGGIVVWPWIALPRLSSCVSTLGPQMVALFWKCLWDRRPTDESRSHGDGPWRPYLPLVPIFILSFPAGTTWTSHQESEFPSELELLLSLPLWLTEVSLKPWAMGKRAGLRDRLSVPLREIGVPGCSLFSMPSIPQRRELTNTQSYRSFRPVKINLCCFKPHRLWCFLQQSNLTEMCSLFLQLLMISENLLHSSS